MVSPLAPTRIATAASGALFVFLFFFNTAGLPHGLTFTTMLLPVFAYYLYKIGRWRFHFVAIAVLAAISLVHFAMGGVAASLIKSSLLAYAAIVFAVAVGHWTNGFHAFHQHFKTILWANVLLVLLALATAPWPSLQPILWYNEPISNGVKALPRLKGFTYEASYYGLLLVPVALYFVWRILAGSDRHWLLTSLALAVPLALCFSLGATAGMVGAVFVASAVHGRRWWLHPNSRRWLLLLSAGLALGLVLLWVFPENALSQRLVRIASGTDTSAKGRLMDSFLVAFKILDQSSWWLGAGLGQIKEVGHAVISEHFNYRQMLGEVMRIPNSMGEWLATFGLLGVAFKLGLEAWLFVRCAVLKNTFRLSLFAFLFVYQFTGSYLINPVEIFIWALAFFSSFPEFDMPEVA